MCVFFFFFWKRCFSLAKHNYRLTHCDRNGENMIRTSQGNKNSFFFFQIKTIKGWNPFHRDKRVQPTATLSGAWTILPAVALPSVSAEESQSHEWQFSTLRCDYGNGRHCKRPDIKCWFMFIHDSKNVEMIHLLDYHPREGFYSFYPASVERENFLKLALCRRRKTIW